MEHYLSFRAVFHLGLCRPQIITQVIKHVHETMGGQLKYRLLSCTVRKSICVDMTGLYFCVGVCLCVCLCGFVH